MLRIGIVAGEPSGDYLAADLIRELRLRVPDVLIEGIGGPQMQAAGCSILFPMEKLAVMGLIEVAGRYLELVGIRNKLLKHFKTTPPDVFIGVDAPDFNLGLEASLHAHGIKTVHYVSPSVWAWRQYRIHKIKQAVDLMLVLFPFEKKIYQQYQIPVCLVGHPLADRIKPDNDKADARRKLGLPVGGKVIAIMPGSRKSELDRMLNTHLQTAHWCHSRRDDLIFITSVLDESARLRVETAAAGIRETSERFKLHVYQDRAHDVLAAADVALLTSGTISLEAMLFDLPMVVAYRLHWLSYFIIRALVTVKFAALPNLLAGKLLVPEFLQQHSQPGKMGEELLRLLASSDNNAGLKREYSLIRNSIRLNAGATAAAAVLSLPGIK